MTIRRNRGVAAVLGAGAVVSSVGATIVGLSAPAIAATAPVCDATQTDTAATASMKTANAKALAAYLKSAPYLKLHAASTKAKTAWVKAKGAKAKTAAKKKWAAAVAKESAAITAFKKTNSYASFSGQNTPAPIAVTGTSGYPGTYNWGAYTTRIITKGGKVVDACTAVDQTHDGETSVPPLYTVTDQDKLTSQNTYEGINSPWSSSLPGNLPVLWNTTTVAPANSLASIEANVHTCVNQLVTVITAPCVKGGLSPETAGVTTATYTVEGYTASLHQALLAAQAAKAIK